MNITKWCKKPQMKRKIVKILNNKVEISSNSNVKNDKKQLGLSNYEYRVLLKKHITKTADIIGNIILYVGNSYTYLS